MLCITLPAYRIVKYRDLTILAIVTFYTSVLVIVCMNTGHHLMNTQARLLIFKRPDLLNGSRMRIAAATTPKGSTHTLYASRDSVDGIRRWKPGVGHAPYPSLLRAVRQSRGKLNANFPSDSPKRSLSTGYCLEAIHEIYVS
jgi:hypothetical protein